MSKKTYNEKYIAKLRAILGSRLKAARTFLGITQVEAAQRIGIGAEFYRRVERGKAMLSVRSLLRVTEGLRVSADNLLGIDNQEEAITPLQAVEHSPEIAYIIDQARDDRELIRLLVALLKKFEKVRPDNG